MPYVHVDLDPEEFDDEDLVEELESRGYICIKNGLDGTESLSNLEHVEHLAACGQLDAAKAEALALVSKMIGRNLQ